MKTLAELRGAVTAAVTAMESADAALREAGEGADLDTLNRQFDEAEAAHGRAVEQLRRAELVAEARSNAPVELDDDEDADGDLEDEADTSTDDDEQRSRKSRGRGGQTRVRREQLTYERHGESNIFLDMVQARHGDSDAAERLQRHRKEMAVEMRAHPSQAAGEGGDFIPPLWLQDEWLSVPRPGRAVADSLSPKPLPAGTNQINLPKVASGSTVAVQTDGGAVSSTDVTTGFVTGQAQTVAGQQDTSMQLHELSQPGIQGVIFDDLTRAYDSTLDQLVLNGTVTNAKGLLQVSGTNAVTFTQATPTLPLLYPKVADAIQRVDTARFQSASVIAMHPRRWGFCLASQDASNRPLIVPTAPQNPAATLDRVAPEGIVGQMQGLPVLKDANIPKEEGGGTNQDAILVYRAEDIYLWETETPRFRVLEEVLSGTLQIRFQLYGYYILIAGRYPGAISKIQGTGLVTPSF